MKKYLSFMLVFVIGCASASAKSIEIVSKNYDAVTFNDGIDAQEAKVIGQRELIKQNLVKFYDIDNPKIVTDVTDLPNNEKYWFVSFREKKVANIVFIFMAIINRDTGKVKFSDDFKEEKRWILEAVLLGG